MGLTFDRFFVIHRKDPRHEVVPMNQLEGQVANGQSRSLTLTKNAKKTWYSKSSKTKFGRNIVIYDTLIYFIYHIHDSFGEWQASCCEHRILRPEICTCTASSRVGSRTKAGQTRQTRQMFLVEEFLTKSNIYQICTWLELLFFLFLS